MNDHAVPMTEDDSVVVIGRLGEALMHEDRPMLCIRREERMRTVSEGTPTWLRDRVPLGENLENLTTNEHELESVRGHASVCLTHGGNRVGIVGRRAGEHHGDGAGWVQRRVAASRDSPPLLELRCC